MDKFAKGRLSEIASAAFTFIKANAHYVALTSLATPAMSGIGSGLGYLAGALGGPTAAAIGEVFGGVAGLAPLSIGLVRGVRRQIDQDRQDARFHQPVAP